MRNFLTVILLSIINLVFSQEKKRVFYNENKIEVTAATFYKQRNYEKNLDLYFENDTLITSLLITRKNHGQLTDDEFKNLKKSLLLENEIVNELIVIVYYPGSEKTNNTEKNSGWNIFDNDYLKKLKKIASNLHFWIYKNDAGLKYLYPDRIRWQQDQNQTVEKLFFHYYYRYGSAVVLDKKGNFISCLGEFGKNDIWEISKELLDKGQEKN